MTSCIFLKSVPTKEPTSKSGSESWLPTCQVVTDCLVSSIYRFSLYVPTMCTATSASVCQSWGVLVSQTESLSQLMKKRSEDLLDGPISKLTLLIRDKQQLRKTYAEQWNLLRQELNKVCD